MSTTFSEREMKLLAAACQCFEGQPRLDMDKFSAMSGLTKGSARNAWSALKKKLYEESGNVGASNDAAPAGKGAKKRPPPVALPARGTTKDAEDESPTKRTRAATRSKGKGKAKKGKAKKADSTDDEQSAEDEEENGFVKVKDEISDEA